MSISKKIKILLDLEDQKSTYQKEGKVTIKKKVDQEVYNQEEHNQEVHHCNISRGKGRVPKLKST